MAIELVGMARDGYRFVNDETLRGRVRVLVQHRHAASS